MFIIGRSLMRASMLVSIFLTPSLCKTSSC
jgi:hypothetical protein